MSTKIVDLNRLKGAVGLKFTVHQWGNRGKADKSKIETDANKDRLSVTKSLIVAEEFDAICEYVRQLRKWIRLRTMPSFFSESIYLVNVEAAKAITEKLETASREYLELVDKFIAVYPARVQAARGSGELNSQFNPGDYPDVNELREAFFVEFCWVSFSTPESLPPELRQKEQERLEKQMTDAADCIMQALREGFLKLVTTASNQLVQKPGEKPKKFFDSSIEQIVEFIETFKQRNLTNDADLEKLIVQAKAIVGDPSLKDIRKSQDVRQSIGAQFSALAESMAGMVEVKKSRKITLTD